jgi:hypothetical protein
LSVPSAGARRHWFGGGGFRLGSGGFRAGWGLIRGSALPVGFLSGRRFQGAYSCNPERRVDLRTPNGFIIGGGRRRWHWGSRFKQLLRAFLGYPWSRSSVHRARRHNHIGSRRPGEESEVLIAPRGGTVLDIPYKSNRPSPRSVSAAITLDRTPCNTW